jgi:hypothetical protein
MPGQEKKIKQEFIKKFNEAGELNAVYALLNELVLAYHPELAEANIALAWLYDVKPDRDAHLTLGWARKASDLDRQLHKFDVIIALNFEWWKDENVTDRQKKALLDHELCHIRPVKNPEDDSVKIDEHGNTVWYARKHDVEEFREVIERHGVYKDDLEQFAAVLHAQRNAAANATPATPQTTVPTPPANTTPATPPAAGGATT